MIRVITFDADDTLFVFGAAMRHGLKEVLRLLNATLGGRADGVTVEEMIRVRQLVGRVWGPSGLSMAQLRLQAFRSLLEGLGVIDEDLAQQLTETYLKARFASTTTFPDVLPTLDALGGRYRLGVITNGNSDPEKCGLPGRFGFSVFAHLCGAMKPDPAIFLSAIGQSGSAPAEIVHVGDSLRDDVAGANAVGITSVWLNRTGSSNDTRIRPDHELRTLTDLPGLVARPP